MFLLVILGAATWRRRRNAHTREGGAANDGAAADEVANNAGVAVVYNAGYRPEEAAIINMPVRQPRRSGRATCCPVRFPEGVA